METGKDVHAKILSAKRIIVIALDWDIHVSQVFAIARTAKILK
jgi:hypothetical protein